MKAWNLFSSVFLSIALVCSNATADRTRCNDKKYADAHPYECRFFGGTAVLGGAGAIGGALALIGLSGASGADGHSHTAQPMPTLPTYNMVGDDIDGVHLAGIAERPEYVINNTQYNEIRVAYSLARGFTGAGSTIAVLDADGNHGAAVYQLASQTIAPNANVDFYQVADKYENFITYAQIGDIITSASNANIFNASWSVPARATDIGSQEHIASITDNNFIDSIINAANRDAIFVFAAGNEYSSQPNAFGALPRVVPELQGHFINVVAWDSEMGRLAEYSNACGITQNYCITAPGTNLLTDSMVATGTSFAAPIVSAAVAVVREAFPYMTAPEITALLFETARDLGTPGIDAIYGHGMLDLERATRPVGVALVPINNGTTMQPLRMAHVSGGIAHNIKSADLKLAYFDKYGRAFKTELSDNISIRNQGRGFGRLRAKNAAPMSTRIGNIEFGIKQSDIMFGDGFMQTDSKNHISFIGTHHEYTIGHVKLSQHTQFGTTSPRTNPNSMITDFSDIYTASISTSVEFANWYASISIPDTIIFGNMNLHLPSGRDVDGQIIYQNYQVDMASRPAIEYSIGYKNISASFIDNPYGTDEFFIMTHGKIQF